MLNIENMELPFKRWKDTPTNNGNHRKKKGENYKAVQTVDRQHTPFSLTLRWIGEASVACHQPPS